MTFLRKSLALGLALGLSWVLYIYGTGNMLSTSLTKVNVVNMHTKLVDIPAYLSADALVFVAENGLSATADPEKLGVQALSKDPANGGAVAFLLSQFASNGRVDEAAEAADLAGRLWPVHTYTHSRLADYWIAQNRIDKLISELSLLLVREPELKNSLFPAIEAFTISSGKTELLSPYINGSPNWWGDFFSYLSRRQDMKVLSDIYKLRVASGVEIGEAERTNMVKLLIRDKNWTEAFTQWQAGLNDEQKSRLSNGLYDGGFEGDSRNLGFGWVFGRNKSVEMMTRATYGMKGQKALRIFFRQGLNRIKFKHLSQQLLLKPGTYNLSFRARLDALRNPKGLVWRVRCVSEGNKLLATGEPLVDRHPWQTFSFDFVVPKSCAVQSLVLEAVSNYPHEHLFSGELWLDDVAVQPVSGVAE